MKPEPSATTTSACFETTASILGEFRGVRRNRVNGPGQLLGCFDSQIPCQLTLVRHTSAYKIGKGCCQQATASIKPDQKKCPRLCRRDKTLNKRRRTTKLKKL